MSANTGALSKINRLTGLALDAVRYTSDSKRDEEMTNRLLRALQLYKENRLGEVSSFVPQQEKTKQPSPAVRARRDAFKQKIALYGEAEAIRMLLQNQPPSVQSVIRYEIRNLLTRTSDEVLRWNVGIGVTKIPKLERTLHAEGLSLGMTVAEVLEVFGPSQSQA